LNGIGILVLVHDHVLEDLPGGWHLLENAVGFLLQQGEICDPHIRRDGQRFDVADVEPQEQFDMLWGKTELLVLYGKAGITSLQTFQSLLRVYALF